MGTFAGHALPGSFFIFFALWAAYFLLKRFYRRLAYELGKSSDPVPVCINRIAYPLPKNRCCRNRDVPLDSFAKAIACTIGITGELITGFNQQWVFVHIGNLQHISMFATFGLSGVVELMVFYGLIKTSFQVEYMFNMIALLAEAFLFGFHLHGRTPVDIYVHMLLFGMILVSLGFGFCEFLNPHHPTYALVRIWGLLMQGTWFWQVGAILYPATSWMPTWDELAKESFPRAANLFCYHMLINFVALIAICCVMSLRVGRITQHAVSKARVMSSHQPEVNTNNNDPTLDYEMKEEETTLFVAPTPNGNPDQSEQARMWP